MTIQSPRIYTYKITFEEAPYFYYGVHKERRYNEEYWGTPITHKWCWDFYTPKKQILEFFDYSDEGFEECRKVETRLIRPVLNDPYCLNESCGGIYSLKILRGIAQRHKENGTGIYGIPLEKLKEQGRINGYSTYHNKTGVHSLTAEEKLLYGTQGGFISYELGLGVHGLDQETRIENARNAGLIGGKIAYELGLGIHGLSKEGKSEIGKIGGAIGGKKSYELGVGAFGMSEEDKRKATIKGGKIAGQRNYELGLGIHGMTDEQRSEIGKLGGKATVIYGVGVHARTTEQMREDGKKGGLKGGKTAYKNKLGCFSLPSEERSELSRQIGIKFKEEKKGIFGMPPEKRSEISRGVGLQKWKCLITGHIANPGNLSKYQKKLGIDTSQRVRID